MSARVSTTANPHPSPRPTLPSFPKVPLPDISNLPLPTSPNPLSTPLPSLRLLVHPTPGLGLDARIPLSRHVRAYMQISSTLSAQSHNVFGVELSRLPFIRLQITPVAKIIVRAGVPLGGMKVVWACGEMRVYDRTEHGLRHGVVPNFGGLRAAKGFKERWKIVRPFVGGCVEVWKGNTVGGLLFDSKMRKAVRYALEDLLQKRETGGVEKVSFPEMRVGDLTEGMTKERLLRRLEERYGPNRIRNNGRELWEKGIGLGGRGLLGGEMGRKLAQDRGGGRGGGGGGGVNEGVRR